MADVLILRMFTVLMKDRRSLEWNQWSIYLKLLIVFVEVSVPKIIVHVWSLVAESCNSHLDSDHHNALMDYLLILHNKDNEFSIKALGYKFIIHAVNNLKGGDVVQIYRRRCQEKVTGPLTERKCNIVPNLTERDRLSFEMRRILVTYCARCTRS